MITLAKIITYLAILRISCFLVVSSTFLNGTKLYKYEIERRLTFIIQEAVHFKLAGVMTAHMSLIIKYISQIRLYFSRDTILSISKAGPIMYQSDQNCVQHRWIKYYIYNSFKLQLGKFILRESMEKVLWKKILLQIGYILEWKHEFVHVTHGLNVTLLNFRLQYSGPNCTKGYFAICRKGTCDTIKTPKLCGRRAPFSYFSPQSDLTILAYDNLIEPNEMFIDIIYQATEENTLESSEYNVDLLFNAQYLSGIISREINTAIKLDKPIFTAKYHSFMVITFFFLFVSKAGRLTLFEIVNCDYKVKITFLGGHIYQHDFVTKLEICELPDSTVLHGYPVSSITATVKRTTNVNSGYTYMHFRFQRYGFGQYQYDSISRTDGFIMPHRLIFENISLARSPTYLKNMRKAEEMSLHIITSTPKQYINVTVTGIATPTVPTDMCSLMGFAIYDGNDTSSDMIGPYCGAFGKDDPFYGTPAQVRLRICFTFNKHCRARPCK